jgi:iron-sulfur cluster assembly protein
MLTLTDAAHRTLADAVARSERAQGLRIVAHAGGCLGLQYRLGLVPGASPDDRVAHFDGLEIYLDPESAALLAGTTIDFAEDSRGAGFVFDNPNARGLCSCALAAG